MDSPESPNRNSDNGGDGDAVLPSFSTEHLTGSISSDQGEAVSVGMLAAGLAWVQRQRERRRQQYLQHQAERQLRKIAEAEMPITDKPQRLLENSTFMQLASGNSSLVGSWEHNREHCDDGARLKVGSPELSKSGEGASGHLDISAMDEDDLSRTPKVRVEEELCNESAFILTPEQMHQVAIHVLPKTISCCRWKRLYGVGRDGDSFQRCLGIIHDIPRTLLVVRTTRGAVFGGYADSPWNNQDQGSSRYYGSAQACLFSVVPGTHQLHVYKWSGTNRYIQLCDVAHKMLAFGGGGDEGSFGLCVQEDFQVGSTGPCDTFGNDPLCDQENFSILELEFWGFLTGVF